MRRADILEKARVCVCGERENEYGSPEDNFAVIAKLWTAYKGVEATPLDVSMLMALLKVARIRTGTATDDSFVDLAGYAACGGEIAGKVMDHGEEKPVPGEAGSIETGVREGRGARGEAAYGGLPGDCSQ